MSFGKYSSVNPTPKCGSNTVVPNTVVFFATNADHQPMARPSPQTAKDPALVALGSAIRVLRKGQGLSQETLAYETGLDRSFMSGVERGLHNLAFASLLKIANRLGVKPSKLLGEAGL